MYKSNVQAQPHIVLTLIACFKKYHHISRLGCPDSFSHLTHTWVVQDRQKFLFSCHSSQTSPSNISTAKPFSVFSFPYYIPMWTLFIMNRLHSPLSYVWYFTESYGTSTSARKVRMSDWIQNHWFILIMQTYLWKHKEQTVRHLLNYLSTTTTLTSLWDISSNIILAQTGWFSSQTKKEKKNIYFFLH